MNEKMESVLGEICDLGVPNIHVIADEAVSDAVFKGVGVPLFQIFGAQVVNKIYREVHTSTK